MNAKLFFGCLFIGAALYLPGQNPNYRHQIGFDAGNFIGRFFNFSGSGNPSDLYQLAYRRYGEGKNTRLGLALNLAVETGDTGGTNTHNSLNFRAGRERTIAFGKPLKEYPSIKHWRAFYGLDGLLQLSQSAFEQPDSDHFLITLGPTPFFGLLFQINNRLSVSTELSYRLLLSVRDSNGATRWGLATSFSPPTAIYAGFDF